MMEFLESSLSSPTQENPTTIDNPKQNTTTKKKKKSNGLSFGKGFLLTTSSRPRPPPKDKSHKTIKQIVTNKNTNTEIKNTNSSNDDDDNNKQNITRTTPRNSKTIKQMTMTRGFLLSPPSNNNNNNKKTNKIVQNRSKEQQLQSQRNDGKIIAAIDRNSNNSNNSTDDDDDDDPPKHRQREHVSVSSSSSFSSSPVSNQVLNQSNTTSNDSPRRKGKANTTTVTTTSTKTSSIMTISKELLFIEDIPNNNNNNNATKSYKREVSSSTTKEDLLVITNDDDSINSNEKFNSNQKWNNNNNIKTTMTSRSRTIGIRGTRNKNDMDSDDKTTTEGDSMVRRPLISILDSTSSDETIDQEADGWEKMLHGDEDHRGPQYGPSKLLLPVNNNNRRNSTNNNYDDEDESSPEPLLKPLWTTATTKLAATTATATTTREKRQTKITPPISTFPSCDGGQQVNSGIIESSGSTRLFNPHRNDQEQQSKQQQQQLRGEAGHGIKSSLLPARNSGIPRVTEAPTVSEDSVFQSPSRIGKSLVCDAPSPTTTSTAPTMALHIGPTGTMSMPSKGSIEIKLDDEGKDSQVNHDKNDNSGAAAALTRGNPIQVVDRHAGPVSTTVEDFCSFQHRLEEVVWRLLSKHNCHHKATTTTNSRDVCQRFVQSLIVSSSFPQQQLSWTWDWVLQNQQQLSTSTVTPVEIRVCMGQELLLQSPTRSWQLVASYLELSQEQQEEGDSSEGNNINSNKKHERVMALRTMEFMMELLDASSSSSCGHFTCLTSKVFEDWVRLVLSRLVALATSQRTRRGSHRTVLTHHAWRTALEWLSMACEYVVTSIQPPSSVASSSAPVSITTSPDKTSGDSLQVETLIQTLWNDAAPLLDQLIELQIHWKFQQEEQQANRQFEIGADPTNNKNEDLLAILRAWRQYHKHCTTLYQYEHQQRLHHDGALLVSSLDEAAKGEAALVVGDLWCRCVAGLLILPSTEGQGDLVQQESSATSHSIHYGIGGLRQTILFSSSSSTTTPSVSRTSRWVVEDVMSWLQLAFDNTPNCPPEAATSNSAAFAKLASTIDSEFFSLSHSLLRGVLAWCHQQRLENNRIRKMNRNKKTNKMKTPKIAPTTAEQHQGLVGSCFRLLARGGSEIQVNLVMAVLNCLWSDSNGLPTDIFQSMTALKSQSPGIPKSFDNLLDAMSNEASSKTSEGQDYGQTTKAVHQMSPTCRALSTILARCILANDNSSCGLKMTQHLVMKHGLHKNTTAHVLLSILLETRRTVSAENNEGGFDENKMEGNRDLVKYASNLVVGQIPSSAYVREHIRHSSSRIFSGLELDWIIPKLICILDDNLQKKKQQPATQNAFIADTTDAVSACLTSIVEIHALDARGLDQMIRLMVSTLESIELQTCQNTKDTSDIPSRRISSKFLDRWRRTLFETSFCGNNMAFGNVLVSMAKTMFESPSSMVPLTLFGGLVGENVQKNIADDPRTKARILFGIRRFIELCDEQLNRDFDSSHAIFGRLAPLLLLRRVPAIYYQIAASQSHSEQSSSASFFSVLGSLSNHLVARLDLDDIIAEGEQRNYSTEERRLAAELSGRCLPFCMAAGDQGAPSTCCTFPRICRPAFGTALKVLAADNSDSHSIIQAIKRARVALYAACHHIPIVSEEQRFREDSYRLTASFALSVLRVNADTYGSDDTVADELVKLQTGCIEFFAICVEKTLDDRWPNTRAAGSLVSELGPDGTENERAPRKGYSSSESLGQICQAVISILRVGKSSQDWVFSAGKYFSNQLATQQQGFSVPARTCLWNAFIVVSQRCHDDDGRLQGLAKATLSWVVEWGISGNADPDIHHPLCVAAALQVTFLLITRTKSLDSLETKQSGTKKDAVRRVHRWALDCARGNSRHQGGDYANRALRLSALKLMLAVFSVDQICANALDLNKTLGPGDISQTFAVLNSLSNLDTDRDVQQLAGHLLEAIRTN